MFPLNLKPLRNLQSAVASGLSVIGHEVSLRTRAANIQWPFTCLESLWYRIKCELFEIKSAYNITRPCNEIAFVCLFCLSVDLT